MSDNFYWKMPEPTEFTIHTPTGQAIVLAPDKIDPRIHIGQYANGTFYWAQDRSAVEAVCRARPDEVLVIGESYDMTGAEFLEYIAKDKHDTSLVGQRFC